jgi:hypothetical protein
MSSLIPAACLSAPNSAELRAIMSGELMAAVAVAGNRLERFSWALGGGGRIVLGRRCRHGQAVVVAVLLGTGGSGAAGRVAVLTACIAR